MAVEEEGLGRDLLEDISTEALEQELLSRQRNLLTDVPTQALKRELMRRRQQVLNAPRAEAYEAVPFPGEPLRHEVRK